MIDPKRYLAVLQAYRENILPIGAVGDAFSVDVQHIAVHAGPQQNLRIRYLIVFHMYTSCYS